MEEKQEAEQLIQQIFASDVTRIISQTDLSTEDLGSSNQDDLIIATLSRQSVECLIID